MAFILDSGVFYAQLNDRDSWHERVMKFAPYAEAEAIYFPVPAITEVTFLLQRNLGKSAVWAFVDRLVRSDLILEVPTIEDYRRAAGVLQDYGDLNIDFVDACIVAMSERLNITKILTVDHRHFSVFRPRHCHAFDLFRSKV